MMVNSVNGDISAVDPLDKRHLESGDGNGATLKYKRRKVSANREFPQGCGRFALRNNEKRDGDSVNVTIVENSEHKVDALVEPCAIRTILSSIDPETLEVGKTSGKAVISESASSLDSSDTIVAHKGIKTLESPMVLDEPKIVNPSKPLDSKNSYICKTELLDSTKNLVEPVSIGLLKTASQQSELLAVPSHTVSSVLPIDRLKTLPIVEAVAGSMQKKYPPRRRTSACRDFPQGCGRNAPYFIRDEYQKSVVSRDRSSASVARGECQNSVVSPRERSLANEKKLVVGSDTKQMREQVWNGDAPKSNPKGIATKGVQNEIQQKSEGGVKKEKNEGICVRRATESKSKRDVAKENSNRPARDSNMSQSDLKSPSSSKTVDREGQNSRDKLGKEPVKLHKGTVDREGGNSGGILGKEPGKLHKGPSIKRKFPEKSVDGCRAINQSQGQEYTDLGSLNARVIVQGLMAAPNCPWRQGRGFKSPSSLTQTTSRSKAKKQDFLGQDNIKSNSGKNMNEAENSEGKSIRKKASPIGKVAYEGDSQLVLKEEDDFPEDDDKDEHRSFGKKAKGVGRTPVGSHLLADKSDDTEAVVTRKKVRETLRLFQTMYRKLVQEDEAKSKEQQAPNTMRFDLASSNILKEKHRWVNTGKPIVGLVPGVEVGDEFHYRVELAIIGLHRPFQSGIDYLSGKNLATSIVASGGYGDDMDCSDVLKYSGQGGNPAGPGKKPEDQKLVRGNLALKNSMEQKSPVRVIRGFKENKPSDSLNVRSKVSTTYIYDGLYSVERFWQEKGRHGNNVFMYELRRIPGQPELTLKEVKKSKKAKVREGLCAVDISQGKEKMPISAINTIDDEKPPPFKYITKMIYPPWYTCTSPRGCECTDGCSDSEKCLCAVKNGGEIPFNYDGAIVEAKPLVYECGPSCKCPPSCHNRVSQHGIKLQLEIFKTRSRGWGVRSLTSIPSGSFICEYTGELLKDKEAEERTNDEYLFDIGKNYNDPFWEGLSTVLPSNLKTSSSIESVEDVGYTIDAARYGNIGRFVNHSCSPNLYAQDVLYDHEDKGMPHVMLFAAENIPPLQELTYHYNYQLDQVRDSDGNVKKKDCYCGAVDCTGRMY